MLLNPGTTRFLYANPGDHTVDFIAGEEVELACPGSSVVAAGRSLGATVTATCTNGLSFDVNGHAYNWRQITCARNWEAASVRTNQSCEAGGVVGHVGFQLDARRFAKLIKICFDHAKQISLYSSYSLTASIGRYASGTPRPSFTQDKSFYSISNVNGCYTRANQRKTINNLLGLEDTDTRYIVNNGNFFLARGHLTARADFVYAGMMNATFKYINAVPQWQTFNGVNWVEVETETRRYASSHKVDLQIWTGTYGIATLPHSRTNKEVELYLYVSGGKKAMPVPALTWKLVYNPSTAKGVVLIGVNNPYEKNVGKHKICSDVSHSLRSFQQFNKTNIQRGYCYACAVPDFLSKVPHAPRLKVSGLLV